MRDAAKPGRIIAASTGAQGAQVIEGRIWPEGIAAKDDRILVEEEQTKAERGQISADDDPEPVAVEI